MNVNKLNKIWMYSLVVTLVFDVIAFLLRFTDSDRRWFVFIGSIILISWLCQVIALILIKLELSKS